MRFLPNRATRVSRGSSVAAGKSRSPVLHALLSVEHLEDRHLLSATSLLCHDSTSLGPTSDEGALTTSLAISAATAATPQATALDAGGPIATPQVTVTLVGPPAITPATTGENQQTTTGLVITPAAADSASVTNYLITNINHGTLFQHDGTTAISNGSMITLAQGAAGLKFTPASNFVGQATFTVQESTDATPANAAGATGTATISVTPATLAGPPVITSATTTRNHQTTSGLVITPAAADSALVTNYLITNITNGTLFQHDGTTAISNGSMITVAQAAAGLKFTPTTDYVGPASFTVQESPDANVSDASGATAAATITVNLAGPPVITPATTSENQQTTTGLVITPAAADGASVTNYLITNISNGTLFQHDGTTAISNGSTITLAQGAAGLKFTPGSNFVGQVTFTVQESPDANPADASGATGTATISVNPATLTGPPLVTSATTGENQQSTTGLVITPAAVDGALVTNYLITGITHGTLFQHDGTTAISNGSMITLAQGAAGLKFTPATNYVGAAGFTVQHSPDANASDANGATATAAITVTPATLAGPPIITSATTTRNHQTTSGLVITPAAADSALVTNYLITNITNGTLFQPDGTTAITNGSMITVAQAAAGLKFTPTTDYVGPASFTVQESPDANVSDASGATAAATITVNLTGPPNVTPTVTGANHQSTSGLVITPSAAETASVTNFQITNITGGTLFQHDGTTVINQGDFISVAQGAAGLKFTPTSGSSASGHFTVQESTSATVGGLGGATATATITVVPAFIAALYQDVLMRPFDDSGGTFFASMLATGAPPETIAATIWQSAEHRGIQVDSYYVTFFHRPADPSGRALWVSNMVGGMSEETVMTALLSSTEYQALHPTATQFVAALYSDLLHRSSDFVGQTSWVTQLTDHTARNAQVIQNFMNSRERHQLLVDSYYAGFLQRPADVGELVWVELLDQALADDQAVAEAFLSSHEFLLANPT